MSKARLNRFFVKRDGSYQIHRNVRDICTFARQNITADPPFSRLDLISCRNVLIYLSPELHKRCIPQFHYALNPGGYLILGPAESVGITTSFSNAWTRKIKFTRRKPRLVRPRGFIPQRGLELSRFGTTTRAGTLANFNGDILKMADRIILITYAPAAVVIDHNFQVQQFRGRTDLFLEHTPGPATLNLIQLARPNLVPDLRPRFVARSKRANLPAKSGRKLCSGEKTTDKYSGRTIQRPRDR